MNQTYRFEGKITSIPLACPVSTHLTTSPDALRGGGLIRAAVSSSTHGLFTLLVFVYTQVGSKTFLSREGLAVALGMWASGRMLLFDMPLKVRPCGEMSQRRFLAVSDIQATRLE